MYPFQNSCNWILATESIGIVCYKYIYTWGMHFQNVVTVDSKIGITCETNKMPHLINVLVWNLVWTEVQFSSFHCFPV